jgi:hypothetical protein
MYFAVCREITESQFGQFPGNHGGCPEAVKRAFDFHGFYDSGCDEQTEETIF